MEINRDKIGTLYWTDYIDGKRVKRQSTKWKTRKEAKAHYNNFMRQYKDKLITLDNLKFNEVVNKYVDFLSLSNKQSTVLRTRQRLENQIAPFFDDMYINKLTREDIVEYQQKLLNFTFNSKDGKKHYSNRHLEIMQTTLRSLLDHAYKFEYINRNPFDQVPFVKKQTYEPKRKITILTLDEFNSFLYYVDDLVYNTVFTVLYWCGLRIGELLALNINDFDGSDIHVYKNFDTKNRIITTTKTNHERLVSVPDIAIKAIEKLLDAYKASELENYDNTRPMFSYDSIIAKTNLDRMKNNYIKQANASGADIPYFTFHELRHTHVSTLLDLGMDSKDIADRLGHSVEMVNNTYGHLFPEKKDKLLEKLNSLQHL